jgi:uncharacterized damage-inducible protein DinB
MHADAERLSSEQIQARLVEARADLDDALATLPVERWDEPLLDGGWSIKDTLAHLMYWQDRVTDQLGWPADRQRERIDDAAIERINGEVYARHHDEPLETVRAGFERATRRFAAAYAVLSETELHDQQRWAWTAGAPASAWAAGDGWEHFGEHAANIRKAAAGSV